MMFTLNPEIPWRIEKSFNTSIDFCLWVLELDGLHVPPFDRHSEGSGVLQARGLDPKSWQKWLATVVALQDPILHWTESSQDQQAWIEEQLAAYSNMFLQLNQHPQWSNEQIDLPALRSILKRHFASYQHQHQAAVALVSHISENPSEYISIPFDVFVGSPAVKELLFSLWQRYKQLWERERVNNTSSQRETVRLTGETNKFWQNLEYLNIYQVKYPTPVEYLVPPKSVIVSFTNELIPESDAFYDFVQSVAIGLTEANSDNVL